MFPAGFENVDAGSAAATCSGGGTISNWTDDGDRNAWADKSNCAGTVSVSGIYVDLPDSVVAYVIEWSNDNGSGSVYIMDDDQVTVTSDVDPSIHFDLDTTTAATLGTAATETAAPYTVDFGTLDPGDSSNNVSGETGINYIHIDLSTNATQGAAVTVRNDNGSAGLVSTSTPTDAIANSTGTMQLDEENYGFCVGGVSQNLGAAMTVAGSYASPSQCDEATDGNDTVELTTTDATILTVSGPVYEGEAFLVGSADAGVLTEAHDDYVDTLTFIAASTF